MQKLLYLFLVVALISCEAEQDYKLGYSGNPNEIVVVTSPEQWKGIVGQSILKPFTDYETVLPQAERKFWVINISEDNFGSLYKTHRNVMIVDIQSGNEERIEFRKSPWSKEQLVCWVYAGSDEDFAELMERKGNDLVYQFHFEEIQRLIDKNTKYGSESIQNQLMSKHKLKITPQKDAYLATDSSNFVWIRLERERPLGGFQHQISQGVMVYYYPYKDTSQLNPQRLLAVKDSVTKKHLPGPSEGSYMAVSKRGELPEWQPVNHKGNYAVQIKGLWRMENNFMGGPFISLTTVDTANQRIVTAEGYVFCPQFDKRDYLYEVEAMIKSLEFVSE